MTPPVRVREATGEDWPFIRKAWRATFLQVGQAVQGVDKQHYFDEMTRLFAALMPTASAKIACHPEDADTNLGFVVYTGPTLHYAYVEQDLRKMGLVPAMLHGLAIKHVTFRTTMGDRRLKPMDRGWSYRPRFTCNSGGDQ